MSVFCSVVIPTIGRDTLSRAVLSAVSQGDADEQLEVVIVNDSGRPLTEYEWTHRERVRVIDTMQRERSIARNTGAAIARGTYLWFLDDDDWMLPGALAQFTKLARRYPDAVWLYGSIRVVDESLRCLAEVNAGLSGNCFAQVMGGEWIPIQASLMRADAFFDVGGYDPFILGTEDEDLCRRMALRGDFASISAAVACLFRGSMWKTSTAYSRAPEDTRRSRDRVLNESGAFTRMTGSTSSAYSHGRTFHAYLSAMRWNMQQRRYSAALSRGTFGLASLFLAGRHALSRTFWNGARADHAPNHLHFIMKKVEGELARASAVDPPGRAACALHPTQPFLYHPSISSQATSLNLKIVDGPTEIGGIVAEPSGE